MQDTFTFEQFQRFENDTVELRVNGLTLSATIVEVTAMPKHGDAQRTPFSIILVSDDNENHGQQMYTMVHSTIGDVELFLVPLGPKDSGMSYEAVFT